MKNREDIIINELLEKRNKGKTIYKVVDNYCSIDLETTGLCFSQDEIIEIGIVKIQNGKIVDSYEQLIKPVNKIPKFIEKLTGITNAMVVDAPAIADVLLCVKDFIGNDVLLGHNICSFDSTFLYDNFLDKCNYEMNNDILDLRHISRRFLPDCENYKLATLIDYFNIECTTHHRALADAENTHLCYEKLKNLIIENNALWNNQNHPKYAKKINYNELTATTIVKNINENIKNKVFVLTGELKSYSRLQAAKLIIQNGGIVKGGISKTVDYLVNADSVVTNKEIRANELISQGCPIKIIDEHCFLKMINNNI